MLSVGFVMTVPFLCVDASAFQRSGQVPEPGFLLNI
ncbi:hypothetical protein EMIT0P258_110084 [Pseudomonas sp. IT-P258]